MTIAGDIFYGGLAMSSPIAPPGWFPDHNNPGLQRYWDGQRWTNHTQPMPAVPGQGANSPSGQGLRARWSEFRTRTKVLLVVAALVLFVALLPGEDEAPTEAAAASGSAVEGNVEPDDATPSSEPSTEPTIAPEPESAAVPAVAAKQLDRARAQLERADLVVRVVKEPSWKPVGTVLSQGVRAGKQVAFGTAVTLVVAAAMPSVPGVVGQSDESALSALRRAGFTVRIVKQVVTSGASGVVLRQTPAATNQAAPGSVVEVVVSNLVRPVAPAAPAPANCTSGYSPCLAPAPDYDCAGGSGDGPQYTGYVRVTGSDPYDLDSDGDGVACES